VILPVIVAPGQEQVISLMPEFIRPQDGAEKQDRETAAAKRRPIMISLGQVTSPC
jgi:hypothetical protein